MAKDPVKFKQECAAILQKLRDMAKPSIGSWEYLSDRIALHARSDNREIREIAISGLREMLLMDRPPSDAVCDSMASDADDLELRSLGVAGKAARDKEKALPSEFKALAVSPVCPPNLDIICTVLWRRDSTDFVDVIGKENGSAFAERILRTLSSVDEEYRFWLIWCVLAFGEKSVGEAVRHWFKSEPQPEIRAVLFDQRLLKEWESWEIRKDILAVGKADWSDVVRKAIQ